MSAQIILFLKATGFALVAIYNLILAVEALPSIWKFVLSAITALTLGWFAYQPLMMALSSVG